MYFFDRKTMYFVWYREDGQAKSVGSAQLTAVENVCRIEVSVTNCGRVEGEFPCYLLSGPVESLLGMIRLQKGKGTLSVRCDADKVGHAQVPYGKLTGIHIDLKGDGYLEQKWLPTGPCTEAQTKRAVAEVDEPERVIGDIMPYRRKENDTEWNIESQRGANSEREPEEKACRVQIPEERSSDQKAGEEKLGDRVPELVQLYADKWQQLCAIYPIVHPFGDARGYLSIEPRDFVVLQEQYQIMVQNSFLLHGFYNYRHLLLGRRRGERGMEYYLGVPGVLYEKERAAALFYGFEAFESAAVPAKDGDFGYYMKRVKI
ncbi:MAG: hypothetical protein LUG61_12350 [Lachnospiraceae bacterium]|nr:hypothetical protein [Lachnospiraceae bacterium]